MSGSGSVPPESCDQRAAERQAEAVEDLADAVERQNRILTRLVDVVAHGGDR